MDPIRRTAWIGTYGGLDAPTVRLWDGHHALAVLAGLGFEPADRDELARVLAATRPERSFVGTGQLSSAVAWSRPWGAPSDRATPTAT